MRLSEAIRLGAMLRPQITGATFRDGGSCAIGAAMEAAGLSVHGGIEFMWPHFSLLLQREVVIMNDLRGCTREEIADWAETWEPAEDTSGATSELTPEQEMVTVC